MTGTKRAMKIVSVPPLFAKASQLSQELPVVFEIDPKQNRGTEDEPSMRDGIKDVVEDVFELVAIISSVNKEALCGIANKLLTLTRKSYIVNGSEVILIALSMGATLAMPGHSTESLVKRV